MKRIGVFFIILVILYSTYYDLTIGTLPNGLSDVTSPSQDEEMNDDNDLQEVMVEEFEPFQEITVEPGNTVLSIVEHLHEGPLSASIQQIVYDFQELNDGTKPEEIKIGETYLFPIYY
ncbi:hypothetical protein JCM9140_698 [Halalkalibacter wakoensis JCM 9140]|uniref:LysM domain-containing protein n=1 Tax=Halalkalibacter wakoensis JCM 9140 TaxID=1236970 RepID=W4PY24_9BACI|nr:hypothetical protein [Halalkalibacter wakoensis]GAE24746.1 hypothetical protein JCM9140_698 [Halalkalibacter wakoensis JCM 9140]